MRSTEEWISFKQAFECKVLARIPRDERLLFIKMFNIDMRLSASRTFGTLVSKGITESQKVQDVSVKQLLGYWHESKTVA